MLDGKTGIVFGVANKRSIAWAIAQALAGAGMRLAFTYQGERLKDNVEELAATLPGSPLYSATLGGLTLSTMSFTTAMVIVGIPEASIERAIKPAD